MNAATKDALRKVLESLAVIGTDDKNFTLRRLTYAEITGLIVSIEDTEEMLPVQVPLTAESAADLNARFAEARGLDEEETVEFTVDPEMLSTVAVLAEADDDLEISVTDNGHIHIDLIEAEGFLCLSVDEASALIARLEWAVTSALVTEDKVTY